MAQSGYTPILIYASGTTTNVPLAANLTSGAAGAELAINYKDGKLFYKDDAGTVQTLATKTAAGFTWPSSGIASSTGSAWGTSYSTSGSGTQLALTDSPAFSTPSLGTPSAAVLTNATGLPLTTGVTGTLGVANGGTGATSLTANNVILGNGTSAVQVVAPSTSGNILTSNGTTWTSAPNTGISTGKSIAMAMIFGG